MSNLAWSRLGAELAEISEITVDREICQIFPGLLPPRPPPRGKVDIEMNEGILIGKCFWLEFYNGMG